MSSSKPSTISDVGTRKPETLLSAAALVIILAFAFFLQTVIVVVGYITRDAIFLNSFDHHELATIVIVASVLGYASSEAYNNLARGYRADTSALWLAVLIAPTFSALHSAK